MKDVIVSFATKGFHPQLLRLIDSCKQHWKGDLLIYSPDHDLWMYRDVQIHHSWPDPEGIQSFHHKDMPYQFKVALIQKAIELGYERIIWLDSSMQLKKDLTPLLDNSKTGVVTFHNLGHPLHKYISDEALLLLGVQHSETIDKPQIWGGAFMLNIGKFFAYNFFQSLKYYSINGSFKNGTSNKSGYVAHRHDQSVMSVLLSFRVMTNDEEYKYDWSDMLPYGQILCPPHDRTGEYGTDPYLVCRGL